MINIQNLECQIDIQKSEIEILEKELEVNNEAAE